MRRLDIEDGAYYVDTLLGYVVMAGVGAIGDGKIATALAFCNPKDRAAGKWCRETGIALIHARLVDPRTRVAAVVGARTVREVVLQAIMAGNPTVPARISQRVRQAAMEALT